MKWKSTLGLMGTSEKLTFLSSAPMYSLKSFEYAGVKMNKETRSFDEAML